MSGDITGDMTSQPPPIDPRGRQQIVEQATALARRYSGWRPPPDGRPELGQALIGVLGRFAELVTERINQVPDRDYLAFLNLIGTRRLPPLPARTALTFSLAEGSTAHAVVPSGTQVAATATVDEDSEVVFETETALVVSPSRLGAVVTSDAPRDTYQDHCDHIAASDPAPFPAFHAEQRAPHELYIACDAVLTSPGTKDVTLLLRTSQPAELDELEISWWYWDGADWARAQQGAADDTTPHDGVWRVRLIGLPELTAHEVHGISAVWLRARLEMGLPRGGSRLGIESVAAGSRAPRPEVAGMYPFGESSQVRWFYVSFDETAAAGGAMARLDVTLARAGVAEDPATGVRLVWSYKVGTEWRPLDVTVEDGTRSLTRDGTVRFRVPRDWDQERFRNRLGRWLRVEIADEEARYAVLPQLASLTASYDWELPPITGISASVGSSPQPLAVPAAFVNNVPLDVSKDFYPFGEQPRFNDTCYLACPDRLARPGAALLLTVRLTNGAPGGPPTVKASDPRLAWEMWDGSAWSTRGVEHSTPDKPGSSTPGYVFTHDADVRITLPDTVAPTLVGGERRHWLRVRLVGGNYGEPAGYRRKDKGYELVPAGFTPPVVASLCWQPAPGELDEVAASAVVTRNDFRYRTHRSAPDTELRPFVCFTPGADSDSALYLGFDQPFGNRPVTLYLQVEPPTPEEVAADRLADLDPTTRPRLVWEYSGAAGWAYLAAVDDTDGLTGSGLVRFIGPPDHRAREHFGTRWHWLRLRWEDGEFPVTPRLRRVLLNTTWATQAELVTGETLGSGTGEPHQRFVTTRTPLLPRQHLLVREPEHPTAEDAAALRAEEGPDAITVSEDDEVWVRWHPVRDFHSSGPRDRHYTVDPVGGEVRFGDGMAGRLPPRGQRNIRITYHSGGGPQGNRDTGTIVTLKTAIPYIDNVTNHERSQGGAVWEPMDRLRARGPLVLRHRNRAVTAQDLTDLAADASTEVARVQVVVPSQFAPTDLWLDPQDPRPRQGHADADAGRVGLIVVPGSPQARPAPSLGLLRRVRAYLRDRAPATAGIWVAGPEWIRVTITATVVPRAPELADTVHSRVRDALGRYLHPLTGGSRGEGWAFGRKPHCSELFALVEAVDGVDHVRSLRVAQQPESRSEELADRLRAVLNQPPTIAIAQPPATDLRRWLSRALVYSGHHAITMAL